MGNCGSIQESDDEQPTVNIRRQEIRSSSTRQEQSNCVVLCENPILVYISDFMLSNDGTNYGGKIFTGYSGKQQVWLKKICQHEKKKMEQELNILSQLSHQNIAIVLYPFDINEKECFLVTEKFGTNLKDSIGRKNYTQKMKIMLQLTDVMSYLQQNRIVHLELSPKNIYIDDETDQIKLINFHKSQKLQRQHTVYEFTDYINGYAAPEIIKQKKVFLSSDIYSLGCIFFFIVTNGFEMHQMEYENQAGKIAARINTIKDDSAFNVLCKDLIQKMLIFAPNKRISMSKIKEHPWSWSAERMTKLIVDVSKLTEKDSKFTSLLFKGSKKVIDGDWTLKLERHVIQTLQEIRQTYQTNNGLNQDDFKGTSILSLLRQLRNLHVHASNDKLVRIMGDNDEDFMMYWNGKFPLLICHLYKSKLDYESNQNGS
ncbi:hypothetical protein ACKWTF_008062 [Chironomus riparius]